MEGKKVEIHLHTPILIHVAQNDSPSHYGQAIARITGKLKKVGEGGILIEALEFIGERGDLFTPPRGEVFLPHHKIDHIYLL